MGVGLYNIQKERELPKLHRAVWKGNLEKVMKLTKGMKTSELNSTDKEKRYTRAVLLPVDYLYMALWLASCLVELPYTLPVLDGMKPSRLTCVL